MTGSDAASGSRPEGGGDRGRGDGPGGAARSGTSGSCAAERRAPLSIAPPNSHKWLEEIDTDVLRTCPDDAAPARYPEPPPVTASSEEKSPGGTGSLRPGPTSSNKAGAAGEGSGGDAGVGEAPKHGKLEHPQDSRKPRPLLDVGRGFLGQKAAGEGSKAKAPAGDGEGAAVGEGGVAADASPGGGDSGERGGVSAPGTDGDEDSSTWRVSWGGTREKLRRVLRAFAVYNRRVSYCQVSSGAGVERVPLALTSECWITVEVAGLRFTGRAGKRSRCDPA